MQYNKENEYYLQIGSNCSTPKCVLSTRSASLYEKNEQNIKFNSTKTSFKKTEQEQEKELKRQWQHIANDWPRYRRDIKVFQLAELGIPFSSRKTIWPIVVGNRHQITKDLFIILQQQTSQIKLNPKLQKGRQNSISIICQDLERTFNLQKQQRLDTSKESDKQKDPSPGLKLLFARGGPLCQSLEQILEIFCCYRPDIGYVQGMTYVASILLTYFDEYQAFVIFSSLMTHPQLIQIYLLDENTLQQVFKQFEKLMKSNTPKIYQMFKQQSINCTNFLLDWILTLFAKPLNPDIIGRLWDRMFFGGTHILWKCGIAILRILQTKQFDLEQTLKFLKYPDITEEQLFEEMKLVVYPFDIAETLGNLEL